MEMESQPKRIHRIQPTRNSPTRRPGPVIVMTTIKPAINTANGGI